MTRGRIIRSLLALALVLTLGIGGVLRARTITHPATGGETMGTGYTARISGRVSQRDLKALSEEINRALVEVNRQMSTWDPDSEISRFNHSRGVDPFPCSAAFASVTRQALELSERTGGAFDPTLQPLLNLWGFGSEAETEAVPTDAALAAAKRITGWEKLSAGESWIKKEEPELSLALGAIAKGHGVDALAAIMKRTGHENWFVEIGGEVAVQGLNPDGDPWRIGIQHPSSNPFDNRVRGVVHLTNGAVATSGDYRNFIEEDGVVYSHILDPRSGKAVKSSTASVTVIAPTCALADGAATALFVMGPVEGVQWVNERPDLEAMFLIRGDEDDEFMEVFSSGFKAATGYTSEL